MTTTELLAHYRATPATDQARFLTTILSGFAEAMTGNYGPCAALNPDKPRCPTCGRKVTDLIDIDVSWTQQDAQITTTTDGETYIDCPSSDGGDFHVAFFLTACCRAALTIPNGTHIEFT
ncbi:hypothetical protein [Demequina lutea]|uniref:Uncharacterized protein n=1 Tax=Demequina lutea TaxID=431489 RepID=A0A7Z0CLI4_9MICO|nr:hypothetical protein [Demequina lutea]NYI42917.1 hypothetical protein [Demequina lutea]